MLEPIKSLWKKLGARGVIILALLLFLLVILVQNLEPVTIDILFWDAVELAKPWFILLCMGIGFLAGFAVGWKFRGKHSRDKPA